MCEAEIHVDTLVSTLTRRGRHERDHLATLRREKRRISGVRALDACMTGDTVRRSTDAPPSLPSICEAVTI